MDIASLLLLSTSLGVTIYAAGHVRSIGESRLASALLVAIVGQAFVVGRLFSIVTS